MNEIHELDARELDNVAGGNALAIGIVLGFIGDKVLDAIGDEGPMTGPMKRIMDEIEKRRPK
jgi:hypothetical protein